MSQIKNVKNICRNLYVTRDVFCLESKKADLIIIIIINVNKKTTLDIENWKIQEGEKISGVLCIIMLTLNTLCRYEYTAMEFLERAGKNVGYMYAWVNGRGQHGNSGRANPRTGQRRLTQDRFALFVFRLSAFEHDKSASARGFVWLPFDNASRINRKLLSLRCAPPSIRRYTSRFKF